MRAARVLGTSFALLSAALISASLALGDANEGVARPVAQASLTAGDTDTCAVASDGTARCWGDDTDGELGDGTVATPENNGSPRPAVDLGQAAQTVVAGKQHTCALLADGSVRCWGYDGLGL